MDFRKIFCAALIVSEMVSASLVVASDTEPLQGAKDETTPSLAASIPDNAGESSTSGDEVNGESQGEKVALDEKIPTVSDKPPKGYNVIQLDPSEIDDWSMGEGIFDVDDVVLPKSSGDVAEKPLYKRIGDLTYLAQQDDGWDVGRLNAPMAGFLVNDMRSRLKEKTELFNSESGIIRLEGSVAVVGDVHGDYLTLKDIMERLSWELDVNMIDHVLFLGDIFDRGPSSSITLSCLLNYFDMYPGKIHLIRGNHETLSMYVLGQSAAPARDDPLLRRIDVETIEDFFDSLPYAAIINGTTLAVHGGIPHFDYWHQFWRGKKIPERNVKEFVGMQGVLWSDYKLGGDGKVANSDRGFSAGDGVVFFDEASVQEFLKSSGIPTLSYLIRGHQTFGVSFYQTPSSVITTVFSAANGQDPRVQRGGISVALVVGGYPPEECLHFN